MPEKITPEQGREIDIILDTEIATPMELYHQVSQALGEVAKCGIVVDLSRSGDEQIYDVSFDQMGLDVPDKLKASVLKLAPALLEADLGSRGQNFDLSGRLTIDLNGNVYLDAEDFLEDWDHQHAIDTDNLLEVEFEKLPSSENDTSLSI